ncbi:mersacidin/lichenicidin family type 2 lantibiotic [Streptomyces sp. HD]|uniref:mersacidin/lichenicidin family type 2 lantibiotic n=1 Tax=Streptomyces sp. HD TaxID=3020892 RepID=UPI002330795D|nr:mersacidin/lichenicidin family type 2 lantibiotic [Streptomyces sp. HD]MDC0773911.1 mersacidin/lichenicidin family type 2 lantibiotic [Streptomyces sp. HD]
MKPTEIVRAWTDPEYRAGLSPAERAEVPDHPSGMVELSDADLDSVAGGRPCEVTTYGTYTSLGWRCIANSSRC